ARSSHPGSCSDVRPSPGSPACSCSISTRICPATCCRSPTLPPWPTRSSCGRRCSTGAWSSSGSHCRAISSNADVRGSSRSGARVSRRLAYSALTVVCVAPRLGILLHERGAVTASFTEKSDTIARMFIDHGTFGFVPGAPTAYTQPLYAWFLIPIYWLFGANWWAVGTAQILVAVATAWLVFEIGRRVLGARAGAVAAAVATLNPYLVWHDVHVNREIVDQLVAAALVLLALVVVDRPRPRSAVLLGVVSGLAM